MTSASELFKCDRKSILLVYAQDDVWDLIVIMQASNCEGAWSHVV